MTRKALHILAFLVLTIITALPAGAQRHFGIIWEPPATEREAARELFLYQQLGIRSLMVGGIHDMGLTDVLSGFDFEVYSDAGLSFLTATRLDNNRTEVLDHVIRHTEYYRMHDFVSAFILFSDGQANSRRFTRGSGHIIDEVQSSTDLPLYYISGNPDHQFVDRVRPDGMIIRIFENVSFPELPSSASEVGASSIIPVTGFIWVAEQEFDIRNFQKMMQDTEPWGDVPVFLHRKWVSSHLQNGLDEVLIAFAGDSEAVFPNPRPIEPEPAVNWHIIILMLIWLSFALHYAFFPTYNKSLFRYFSHHQFFIEDIFQRRIRFTSTLLYIHLQTALIFGLFFHAIYSFHLNTTGVDVLKHYNIIPELIYPSVFLFGAGVVFNLVINTLLTLWVFAPSLEGQWFNPAAVTFIWPQQLLLPVITLMITVSMAGASPLVFNMLAILFLLIWISSFYVAAINVRRHVEKKTLYDGLSWGLQLPLTGILCWWVFIELGLWDVLVLAAFVN